jgi:RNA polymerase sigma-70 factor (ECF subfamily)
MMYDGRGTEAEPCSEPWQLISAAAAGDVSAFEHLYRRYSARIHGLCLRLTGDREAAEDCTQEAFIAAWRALHKFEGRSSFSTWLHSMAIRAVLSRRKGLRAKFEVPEPPTGMPEQSDCAGGAPPLDLERAIAALPEAARPVFMAACVAVGAACLASIFTWAVLRRVQAPGGLPAVAGVGTFQEPGDAKYIKARETLQQTFRERLLLLEPGTRVKIEASLAVIRRAHEDIRQALLADPSSPVLEDLRQSTWHDEIDLYDRVVEATQPAVRS